MDKRLFEILVCPVCKSKLILEKDELICRFDRLAFPIIDDIPIMLTAKARELTLEDLDNVGK